jgi:hypothetical protein
MFFPSKVLLRIADGLLLAYPRRGAVAAVRDNILCAQQPKAC